MDWDFYPEFCYRDGLTTAGWAYRCPLIHANDLDAALRRSRAPGVGYFVPTGWGWPLQELEAQDWSPQWGDSVNTDVPVRLSDRDVVVWGLPEVTP